MWRRQGTLGRWTTTGKTASCRDHRGRLWRALGGADSLKGSGAEITIVDRRNHHLFQPLLYQVATSALTTSDIAWPIRHLMKHRKDVTTLLGNVSGIDARGRKRAAR